MSALCSVRTSAIRLADSLAIVIITKIIETIIRLLRIIKLYVSSAENWPTSKSSPRVVMMVYEPKKSTNTITVYRQNCIIGVLSARIFSARR